MPDTRTPTVRAIMAIFKGSNSPLRMLLIPFIVTPIPIRVRFLFTKCITAFFVPSFSALRLNEGTNVRPIARINIGAITSAMA